MNLIILNILLIILNIFLKLLKPILFILGLIAVLVILKIIFNYRKYGKSIFESFKIKKTKEYYNNLIINIIKNVSKNSQIVNLQNLNSKFLIIDSKGVFLLYHLNENGKLKGKTNDEYLSLEQTNKLKKIQNPYNLIKQDLEKLQKHIEQKITPLIICNNYCIIYMKLKPKEQIIKLNKLYETINKKIKKSNEKLNKKKIINQLKKTNFIRKESEKNELSINR